MSYLFIPADPAAHLETRAPLPSSADLLAAEIGCQYIEVVHSATLRRHGMALVIDEEGRLINRPINERATALAEQLIVGDALLCGEVDTRDGRDLVELSEAVLLTTAFHDPWRANEEELFTSTRSAT